MVVGIADCRVSRDSREELITYALGSCIAVAIFDPVARVGGLLHYMLPDSSMDRAKAERNPYMFGDTGITALLQELFAEGASPRRLIVRLAGGARMVEASGVFDIGKRNHLVVRKMLWKAGILVHGEAVGGSISRNLRLEIATGRCWLRPAGEPEKELAPLCAAGKVEQWQFPS